MLRHRYGLAALALVTLGAAAVLPVASSAVTLTTSVSDPTPALGDVVTVTVATTGELLPAGVRSVKIALQFNSPDAILLFVAPANPAESTCPGSGIAYPLTDTVFLTQGPPIGGFPQVVTFTAASSNDIRGVGCVATFQFQVVGANGQSNFVLTSDTEFRVGGTPIPLVFPAVPSSVVLPNVTGVVNTWTCAAIPGGAPSTVPEVRAALLPGPYDVDYSGIENPANPQLVAGGNYSLAGRIGSSYTLDFSRGTDSPADFAYSAVIVTDLQNQAIDGGDVGLIMQYWNNPIVTPLTACPLDASHCPALLYPQRIAADVNYYCSGPNCDPGEITGQDASILLRLINFKNGVALAFPGFPDGYPIDPAGPTASPSLNWRFFCGSRSTGVLTTTGVAYNPVAVLVGDVNGSYINDPNQPRKTMAGTTLAIGTVGSTAPRVTIPVQLRDARSVVGLDARIEFDANVLRFVEAKPAADSHTQVWGTALGGTLSLVVIGSDRNMQGSATIANLVFDRVDPSATNVSTTIGVPTANADGQLLDTESGFFTSSPTAVTNSDWGRVKVLFR